MLLVVDATGLAVVVFVVVVNEIVAIAVLL